MAELDLSEESNVKSGSSEMQPGQKAATLIQPQTPEIMEIDVQKMKKRNNMKSLMQKHQAKWMSILEKAMSQGL